MPTKVLCASLVAFALTLLLIGAQEYDFRIQQAAQRIVYIDPLKARVDDMMRRTCVLYDKRVAAGTMKAGEPEFADCPL